MRGQSRGKTMYVVPYLMAPPGSPLEPYAAGVELTDNRPVVLHMIRMARVGVAHLDNLADPATFVRAVHVTGDLENLGQGTDDDQRYFVTVADQRTILHFGSSYGGNALLGKIAHGLRQACYDGRASGIFLAEQFMLLGITDKETGQALARLRRLPERLGQDQPRDDAVARRPRRPLPVEFYGDDIAWLWVDDEGRRLRHEPGERRLRRRQGHQREDQPHRARLDRRRAAARSSPTSPTTRDTQEVWWEGKTKEPPTDEGWLDWKGEPIADRVRARRLAVGAPQQPVHHHAGQRAERGAGLRGPGRRPDRRDHLRRPHQRPRAAGARDHRPGRGRLRRPDAGRRGDVRRRRPRRPAALRPDVDAAVPGLPRGRLRRALAEDHRRGEATSRSSPTSTGSRRTCPTAGTATSCGPATARTCAPLLWLCRFKRRRGRPACRRRSASSRPRRSSTSPASTSPPRTSTASSPSTCRAGARRWASARST